MIDLIAFAKEEFRLSKRGKDGATLRETIEVYERMTGKVSSERALNIDFPVILYDLWSAFLDMHYARGSDMNGLKSISYLEIQAYSQLKRICFDDWELNALRMLDSAFLQSQQEK